MASDTIFALASGAGVSGVAIIRLSGEQAFKTVADLTRSSLPLPRSAVLRKFFEKSGRIIDEGLVIRFPSPASFTGEDVAELHVHGGIATVDAMLKSLAAFDGLRLAEPGEFTRRAFENGKLDLTSVEALSDLIAAETEAQRLQALRQLGGDFGKQCDLWRDELIGVLANLEAWIDFPDEDLPGDLLKETKHKILCFFDLISQYVDINKVGERIRSGFSIAIIGPPNAGKSSLLNFFAGRDAAIVSNEAGTTRDVVEVKCSIGGLPVTFSDTAGLRQSMDQVEGEGVKRALAVSAEADLQILVRAPDCSELDDPKFQGVAGDGRPPCLKLWNKSDLGVSPVSQHLSISVKTGMNCDKLVEEVEGHLQRMLPREGSAPLTRRRHREALENCLAHLERAGEGSEIELIAEDIRMSARALGKITGRVDVEDILDRLFNEVCIGK